MIWFALLGIIFFIGFLFFTFSWRRDSELGAGICCAISVAFCVAGLVNFIYTLHTPEGFEKQEVYEITEDSVLRKSTTTYYQDENSDWYIMAYEDGWEWKHLVKPFYEFDYEKVEPPVFRNGNFVIGDTDEVVSSENTVLSAVLS